MQHDLNIANQSFPSFRTDLNNALSAIQTCNSGTSRPTGAVAGQIWLDTTSATSPTLKYYDGADDISLATLDHTGNTVNWLDSTVSVTGLTTTATGTVLTLSDSSLTSSVNLILQNQKEIRFSETTANGTNYVGFKAPATLSADKIWILPSADGTAGQFLKTDGAGNLSFSSDLPTTSFTGATVETSIADSDLVLIYDDSATAVRKMTKANLVAGIGASAGQVIQVVQTIKKDTFYGNSTSYVDVTGLSATITPSSASNKVLVLVNLSLTDQHGSGGGAILLRGSTAIGQADTAGSRRRSSFSGSGYTGDGAGENQMQVPLNASVLDSPATTSATTYKVQIVSNGGNYYGVNLTVNSGSVNDPDNTDSLRMVSSITLMEVKG